MAVIFYQQDIRSFFSVGNKTAPVAPNSTKKRKPIALNESDDDTPRNGSSATNAKSPLTKASVTKKRRVIYSSDEDEPKATKAPKDANSTVSSKLSKLKAVNVSSAFGSAPIKRIEKEKKPKKSVFDADTDEMELMEVDEELLTSKAKNGSIKKEIKEEKLTPVKEKVLKSKNDKTPEKKKIDKTSPLKVKTEKTTPHKTETKTTEKQEKHSPTELIEKSSDKKRTDDHESKRRQKDTPTSNKKKKKESLDESVDLDRSVYDPDQEKHEKRRAAAMLYKQFQKRAGPSNPGSKEIPKGKPNCLAGLAFVLTGVFESMERDEAAAVIKEYGGRVTSALSGKTNYMVAGDESGPSKLAKAEELNVTILSEDDLLDLIREKSGIPTLKKKSDDQKDSPKHEKQSKTPTKADNKSHKKVENEKRIQSPAKHEPEKKVKVEEKPVASQGNLLINYNCLEDIPKISFVF